MKICIVKLSAMGDIIHAMVALQFVKKSYPNAIIDWVVEESFKGVLENNKDIDTILPISLKKIKKNKKKIFSQISLLNEYSKNNYDVVIDAQGLLKSAIVSRILGNKILGSYIVGFDKKSIREGLSSYFYTKTVNIAYEENAIRRNIKVICKPLDIVINDEDILNKDIFLCTKENNIKKDDFILFVVGASKRNKIYPKEKFLEIAIALEKNVIVVWGNEEEEKTALYLQRKSSFIKAAPKGNLDDLKSLIQSSNLVIGGDTGPTHMAWGLNVPSITIFGNTPSLRNSFITKINKVVKSKSNVNALKLDKSDFSIKDIDSEDITIIAKKLINENK